MPWLEAHPDGIREIQRKALEWKRHILSSAELEAVRQSMGVSTRNIGALGETIDYLIKEISRLREYQDSERRLLENSRIAVTPIRNVPREIWAEIFVHALDGRPISLPTKQHDAQLPWSLLRVCSLWRNIALGDKRLWDHVMVQVDASLRSDAKLKAWNDHIARGLEELIFPYCNDKISFGLISSGALEHRRQTRYSLRSLLVPCLPRLRELTLHLPAETISTFYDLPSECFSGLQSMDLQINYEIYIDTSLFDQQIFRRAAVFDKAHCLRKFSLHSDWYHFVLPERLPWSQIVDLNVYLSTWKLPEMLNILRQCVNARRCVLGSSIPIRGQHDSSTTADPITLPHLEHLGLRNVLVLDLLTLPSLTSLHLENRWDMGFEPKSLVSLIERSECALRALSYNSQPESKPKNSELLHAGEYPWFEQLLDLLPILLELRMPYVIFGPEILILIAHGHVLPALTELECHLWQEDTPDFVHLVEQRLFRRVSRTGPSHSIHSLREAVGRYVLHPDKIEVTKDAHARIEKLSEIHGQRVKLVRRWPGLEN
ncbi:hypothetical protein LshimejAT787_0606400 [Lyophyllum shimeji]|uniref:F-box domain-containing protein n=1 Tax=Lyophyllum shimeji TaxID=47721 RepID=A0A9P3PP48_LYOSH|nr:hypothetical protein LshimejAT787_0606400 [Lyophyllum shimeji]